MNTLDTQEDIFSVEALESRFEMLAAPVTGGLLHPDWSCEATLKFIS